MNTDRRIRPSSKLPQLRWASYAIAAGATAAGTLPTVEAAIHYSGPVNYKFHGESTFKTQTFPLSNGAYLQGFFNNVGFANYHTAGFGVLGAGVSNSLRGPGPVNGFELLAALPRGSVVSNGQFFRNNFYAEIQNASCANPDWQDRGTYYAGFRFNTGAGPQYGWARIVWGGCGHTQFVVKDYAWGDVGDRIKTGQRQSKADETQVAPQAAKRSEGAPPADALGSLGLLALGAVGVEAWRAKKAE